MKKQLLNLFIGSSLCSLFIAPSSSFAQVPNYVPTNGLVGYWPFNGNANDESGNGNNGTVNGATLTTDRFGVPNKAYSFSNNYISVNRTYQPEFTVSIWFYSTNPVQYNPLIDAFDGTWEIQLKNSFTDFISFSGVNIYQEFLSNQPVTSANWHHLVCTYSLNNVNIYINGILTDIYSVNTLLNNNGNYYFGASLTGSDQFFSGSLDDIGIWNRALTQCEIQDLFHAQLNAAAGISAGPDQTVCEGAFITLNGSGGTNYIWNNSVVDGVPFIPTASMDYPVLGQDANGCIGTDTMHVELIPTSSSTLTETALDSYTLNGQTYMQSGTFTQVIPNAAGCDSTITLNLSLDFTGINEPNESFSIAPNPTTNDVTITSTTVQPENYTLFDTQGRKVLSGSLSGNTTQLDLSQIERGNYLLQIGEKKVPFQLFKN